MTVNENLIFDTKYFEMKMKISLTQFHLLFVDIIMEKIWSKLNNKIKKIINVTNKEQKVSIWCYILHERFLSH